MVDKKTLGLAVLISWVLTLATVLFISNFAPNLALPFPQQTVESNSVKAVTFEKQEVINMSKKGADIGLYPRSNFTWTPSNPTRNAILGIVCSFEYKVSAKASFYCFIKVYNYQYNDVMRTYDSIEEWKVMSFRAGPADYESWINPNQAEYPIEFFFAEIGDAQLYIRNVNLILLVVDG